MLKHIMIQERSLHRLGNLLGNELGIELSNNYNEMPNKMVVKVEKLF